jgi:hypothetical protein
MNKCIYCGEEKEYTPIVPKPGYFIYKNTRMSIPDQGKPVCLKCLSYEIEELKDFE